MSVIGGLTRPLMCLLPFGLGSEALGGGVLGVTLPGGIALATNWKWRNSNAPNARSTTASSSPVMSGCGYSSDARRNAPGPARRDGGWPPTRRAR